MEPRRERSLLTDAQRLALFPVYAGKYADEGQKQMILLCKEKTTIDEALQELETLRDGDPPLLTLVKRYHEITTVKENYKSAFFELLQAGVKAKVSYLSIILRYLQMCPRGQKFYDDHAADFVAGLTKDQAIALYKRFAPKLAQYKFVNDNSEKHVYIHVFT